MVLVDRVYDCSVSAYENGFLSFFRLNFYKIATMSFFFDVWGWTGVCVCAFSVTVGSYYCVDCQQKNLTRVHVETACYIGLSLHCFKEAVCCVLCAVCCVLDV